MKSCSKCNVVKSLDEFHRQAKGPQGRHSWGKPCANSHLRLHRKRNYSKEQRTRWNLKKRYCLTSEQILAIIERQRGRCAICYEIPKRPCIDNCHRTGKVRGILCHRCNVGIPILDDNDRLIAAIKYLGLPLQQMEKAA